jgi:hypothetical protein
LTLGRNSRSLGSCDPASDALAIEGVLNGLGFDVKSVTDAEQIHADHESAGGRAADSRPVPLSCRQSQGGTGSASAHKPCRSILT